MYAIQITTKFERYKWFACAHAKMYTAMKRVWHQTIHVHTCKIKCNTLTRLCVQYLSHEMILLTTSAALSFVICTYRNLLFGGMLTDILGHSRCTAYVATCMYIANIYICNYRHNDISV